MVHPARAAPRTRPPDRTAAPARLRSPQHALRQGPGSGTAGWPSPRGGTAPGAAVRIHARSASLPRRHRPASRRRPIRAFPPPARGRRHRAEDRPTSGAGLGPPSSAGVRPRRAGTSASPATSPAHTSSACGTGGARHTPAACALRAARYALSIATRRDLRHHGPVSARLNAGAPRRAEAGLARLRRPAARRSIRRCADARASEWTARFAASRSRDADAYPASGRRETTGTRYPAGHVVTAGTGSAERAARSAGPGHAFPAGHCRTPGPERTRRPTPPGAVATHRHPCGTPTGATFDGLERAPRRVESGRAADRLRVLDVVHHAGRTGRRGRRERRTRHADRGPARHQLPGCRLGTADRCRGLRRQRDHDCARPARVPGAQDPGERGLRGRSHGRVAYPSGRGRLFSGGTGHPQVPDRRLPGDRRHLQPRDRGRREQGVRRGQAARRRNKGRFTGSPAPRRRSNRSRSPRPTSAGTSAVTTSSTV